MCKDARKIGELRLGKLYIDTWTDWQFRIVDMRKDRQQVCISLFWWTITLRLK